MKLRFRFRIVDLLVLLIVWSVFLLLFIEHVTVEPLNALGVVVMCGNLFWVIIGLLLAMESEKIMPDFSNIPRSEM